MKTARHLLLPGLCAMLACGAAQAASARPALGSSAAFDAQGRLWVAYADSKGLALQTSSDEGQSWSLPRHILRTQEALEANGETRPKIAFGPEGNLYLSWTQPLSKPYTGDIRFTRSTDGGRTFAEPLTVQADRAVIAHRFDTLAVDGAGRVFIAWTDHRDAAAARAAQQPYSGAAIYYAVSANGGAGFGPETRLAEHNCECCRLALADDGQGRMHAMWRHIFEPNIRDHASAILAPQGKPGAIQRATFDNWRIDACPHTGPSLSFDGAGKRHQVWFSAANDDGGLFYAGGDGQPMRVGGPQAERGEVLAAGQRVAVIWKEFDGSATRVNGRLSSDGGNSWRDAQLAATQGASDHPHLVRRGAEIWLVWRTADEGFVVRRTGE